jgi:hypothetical protein
MTSEDVTANRLFYTKKCIILSSLTSKDAVFSKQMCIDRHPCMTGEDVAKKPTDII